MGRKRPAPCPQCAEPSPVFVERDGARMCPECAEHLDNEAALEASYGDAMFEDEAE